MGKESAGLVGAVLAGERGDLDQAVESLKRADIPVEVFDTTANNRYRRIAGAGVTVTPVAWPGSFGAARNAGIESMVSRGVGSVALWIDTDEQMTGSMPAGFGDLLRQVARAEVVLCPEIQDSRHSTSGVARMHSLDGQTRFTGRVHEYLVRANGHPITYLPIPLRVRHEGYSQWNRASRNGKMLRAAIEEDTANPRWRPFLVRDASADLDAQAISRAIREQARLGVFSGEVGGITSDEYTRMIAWHGMWGVADKAPSPLMPPALSRLRASGEEVRSELLYLRIISEAMLGPVGDRLLDEAFEYRRGALAKAKDVPWLDAGISVALDANGRNGEAAAYRSESTPFNDPFCEDSRLRSRFTRRRN